MSSVDDAASLKKTLTSLMAHSQCVLFVRIELENDGCVAPSHVYSLKNWVSWSIKVRKAHSFDYIQETGL